MLLEMNDRLLKCKQEVGELLQDMDVGAHPRWTARQIDRAADLGYVTLKKASELLPDPRVSDDGPDFRKVYPLPTEELHRLMEAWGGLLTHIGLRTHSLAVHYNGGQPLPTDVVLPKSVQYDFVGFLKRRQEEREERGALG